MMTQSLAINDPFIKIMSGTLASLTMEDKDIDFKIFNEQTTLHKTDSRLQYTVFRLKPKAMTRLMDNDFLANLESIRSRHVFMFEASDKEGYFGLIFGERKDIERWENMYRNGEEFVEDSVEVKRYDPTIKGVLQASVQMLKYFRTGVPQ